MRLRDGAACYVSCGGGGVVVNGGGGDSMAEEWWYRGMRVAGVMEARCGDCGLTVYQTFCDLVAIGWCSECGGGVVEVASCYIGCGVV